MQLTDEAKAAVKQWVEEGASLSDVQRLLKESHNISLTYLDTRFLVDDLKLTIQSQTTQSEAIDRLAAAKEIGDAERSDPKPTGSVRVQLDTITRPQALVSGKVHFSDGESASWMLDQMGRLSLNPSTVGYRPSQSDIAAFQDELQRAVQGLG